MPNIYGNETGPGSLFRALAHYYTESQDESGAHIVGYRAIEVTSGDFWGTQMAGSWYDGTVTVGSAAGNNYAVVWFDLGHVNYGSSASLTGSAGYTSGSTWQQYESSFAGNVSPDVPTWQPSAPTIGSAVRVSDTQATISWTNNATVPRPYESALIERQSDGGGWQQVASVSGTASSFSDTSVTANHAYRYRVRARNSAGTSDYSGTSNQITNTPSAPGMFRGVFNAGSATIALSWQDNAITETGFELQNSATPSFAQVTTKTLSANTTSYTSSDFALGTGGYTYFRIRAVNGNLASAWTTATVKALSAPSAPTLIEPNSGAVFDNPNNYQFKIQHNPTDGTGMTQATFALSKDNRTWRETTSVSETMTRTKSQLETTLGSTINVGDTIFWKAKTKGAYSSYGQFSGVRSFRVEQAPTIIITQPAATDGGTIEDVPVTVKWTYNDVSGTQARASVSVRGQSWQLWSGEAGTANSIEIPVSTWLPADNSEYTVTVSVVSTSGLGASGERVFRTDYDVPNPPVVTVEHVDGFGVQITLSEGSGESTIQPVAFGVFRVTTDGEEAIVERVSAGVAVIDRVPPLDQRVQYRGVAYAASGVASSTIAETIIDSDGTSAINWGESLENVAYVQMDLTWSVASTPDRALFQVVGLTDPVERHTKRRTKSLTCAGTAWWDDAAQYEALQKQHGTVWFREPRGHSIPVVLSVANTFPSQPIVQTAIQMVQVAR